MPTAAATTVAAASHLRAVPMTTNPQTANGELERLFRDHSEQVFRAAYRITGSSADAEDVLQTVFLRLASGKRQTDLAPSPGSYLHRAAVNASLDLLRARTRSKSVSMEDHATPREFESSILSPAQEHEDKETRALVRQAVARLGERAAAVFTLRYFEGYDNREIAEMLGTSQMVVAVTLHRARTRLRKEIGEYMERHHEA
ncbi:MAG: sigma-70 family RNA polymerase sigma factor [Acidobacteria bacterium]|nr:sigma-70 family RNA polymerase sigma factor [Acidobacteriota bacterium]